MLVGDTLHLGRRRQDILTALSHIHLWIVHHRVEPARVLSHGHGLGIGHRAHIRVGIVSFDVLVDDGSVLVSGLHINLW